MASQTPQPGLLELMTYLQAKRGVRKALCTRNFPAPVRHLRETFMPGIEFDPVITRETVAVRPKPSPEGIWRCAERWAAEGEGGKKGGVDGRVESSSTATTTLAVSGNAVEEKTEGPSSELASSTAVIRQELEQGDDPLELARRHLGAGIIMVGDSLDDMAAGYRAGAATILLASGETEPELLADGGHEYVDLVVRRLDEIIEVLERGFEGRS